MYDAPWQFHCRSLPDWDAEFAYYYVLEPLILDVLKRQGVPVIAARSGGNAELVEHGRTGLLVPPQRPEALARAITRLTRKPELLIEMGLAARERARALFSLADCVKAYEAVYSRVISTCP